MSPPRSNPAATLLFWVMFGSAGTCLAACLLLPVWLEYRGLRAAQAATVARIAEMEQRLESYEHQIDHLLNDPAYLERLARQEFGLGAQSQDVIFVAAESRPAPSATAAAEPPPDRLDELGVFVEQAAAGHPLISLFVRPETRPAVMLLSGAVLIVALVSLNWRRAPAAP